MIILSLAKILHPYATNVKPNSPTYFKNALKYLVIRTNIYPIPLNMEEVLNENNVAKIPKLLTKTQ